MHKINIFRKNLEEKSKIGPLSKVGDKVFGLLRKKTRKKNDIGNSRLENNIFYKNLSQEKFNQLINEKWFIGLLEHHITDSNINLDDSLSNLIKSILKGEIIKSIDGKTEALLIDSFNTFDKNLDYNNLFTFLGKNLGLEFTNKSEILFVKLFEKLIKSFLVLNPVFEQYSNYDSGLKIKPRLKPFVHELDDEDSVLDSDSLKSELKAVKTMKKLGDGDLEKGAEIVQNQGIIIDRLTDIEKSVNMILDNGRNTQENQTNEKKSKKNTKVKQNIKDKRPFFDKFKRKKDNLTEAEKKESEEKLQKDLKRKISTTYNQLKKGKYDNLLKISCSARTGKGDDKDYNLKVFEGVVKNVTDNIGTLMQELKDSPEVVKLIVAKLANNMYSIDNKILFIDTYINGMVNGKNKK